MEICKGIFFFLTISIGFFFLRGKDILNSETYIILKEVFMPGYLIFCGIMLGYILARINIGYQENHEETKIYTKFFLGGIGIGILLAIIYIVL